MEKLTSKQAIELIGQVGEKAFKEYFKPDSKMDKSAVQSLVDYVKQTKDENVYLNLVRANAKFAAYNPFMKVFPVLDAGFLTKQFLANPDVLNLSAYSSQTIKRIKDEWNKNTFVNLSLELQAVLEEAFYQKREKEKQAKKSNTQSNTSGRVVSVSGYDGSTKSNVGTRYVQRGGGITNAPVYGGKNKRL